MGAQIWAIAISFSVLSSAVTAARVYIQVTLSSRFRLEDYLMVLAFCFSILQTIFLKPASDNGLGKRTESLDPDGIEQALKWLFASQVVNITAYFLAKLSITGQLLRFTDRRAWRCSIHGIVIALTITQFFDYIFLFAKCAPISRQWKLNSEGSCWTIVPVVSWMYIENVVGILSDIALVVVPIFLLRNAQLNNRKRAAVLAILLLGVLATAMAIFRATQLQKLLPATDLTFVPAMIAEASIIELNVGIIAASIVALRPFFKFFDNEPDLSNISLPLSLQSPTPQKRKMNFDWNIRRQLPKDEELEIERTVSANDVYSRGGVIQEDQKFTQSTQDFLLGLLPSVKPAVLRSGQGGRSKGRDGTESIAWG